MNVISRVQGVLGRAFLVANGTVLGLLIGNLFFGSFIITEAQLNAALYNAAQFGWLAAALVIFILVVKTHLKFREKKLLVGSAGFFLIVIAYWINLLVSLANVASFELDMAVNISATIGYGAVAIAVGWLK
jgi:hypothetical protein